MLPKKKVGAASQTLGSEIVGCKKAATSEQDYVSQALTGIWVTLGVWWLWRFPNLFPGGAALAGYYSPISPTQSFLLLC